MATAAQRLIAEIVDHSIAIDDMAVERQAAVSQRFAELLNAPEEVSDDLLVYYLDTEMEDSDLPDEFWDQVADLLDLGFDGMQETPIVERGEIWVMARGLYVAACRKQAMIEEGGLAEAWIMGVESGQRRDEYRDDLDLAELAQTADFKNQIKARRAEIS